MLQLIIFRRNRWTGTDSVNQLGHFLSHTQKRLIFTHSPLTNFQTFFCIVLFDLFHSQNTGPKTLHNPLQTFKIFGPSAFGYWFQSAHDVPTRLKMSAGGFQILWIFFNKNVSILIKITRNHLQASQKWIWTKKLSDERLKVYKSILQKI